MISENSGRYPDELATDEMHRDVHQCNWMCRRVPSIGRFGDKWAVYCLCRGLNDQPDAMTAVLAWNRFQPLKRLTPTAKKAAIKAMYDWQKMKETGGANER